jgi:hypothetical protein
MRLPARAAALASFVILASTPAIAAAPEARAKPAAVARSAASSPAATASAAASASAAAIPIEFDGTLESGRTYVAEVAWDNNALHIWRPVKDVKVPRQHAWSIDWTNLAQFTSLKSPATRAKPQRFHFRVTGVDVSSGSPAMAWTTIYHCEVLAVDGVAGPPAAATRRK